MNQRDHQDQDLDSSGPPRASLRIEIFTDDLDSVVDFYTGVLRFRLQRDERGGRWPYVALERGWIRIGAAHRDDPVDLALRRPPTGTEIVLEVSDIRAERDRVAAKWPLEEDLVDRPWGLLDFRVLDPAGYYLRITGFDHDVTAAPWGPRKRAVSSGRDVAVDEIDDQSPWRPGRFGP